MRKLLSLLLACVMVLGLFAACGGQDTPDTTAGNDAPETTAAPETPDTTAAPVEAGVITKIALVTDVGTIDDESFNQACWQGVEAWATANGIEYTYYQPAADSTDDRVLSVAQAIAEGANTVVMPGYLFGATLTVVMEQYPDVNFIAVDVAAGDLTVDYTTYYDPTANVACSSEKVKQATLAVGS